MSEQSGLYICQMCGFVYDPADGDAEADVSPGTPFDQLPEDWFCPVCGANQSDFAPEEEAG